jgi:hypothetical protein
MSKPVTGNNSKTWEIGMIHNLDNLKKLVRAFVDNPVKANFIKMALRTASKDLTRCSFAEMMESDIDSGACKITSCPYYRTDDSTGCAMYIDNGTDHLPILDDFKGNKAELLVQSIEMLGVIEGHKVLK